MSTPVPPVPADAWVEVALNGPWSRQRQPLVPLSVAEIVAEGVACARAGAALVHYHAYDVARGAQSDDLDLHRRIIEGIRSQVDVLVYPTTTSRKLRPGVADTVTERFALARALGRLGLLDCLVIDPGSHLMLDPQGRWAPYVYANYGEDVQEALAICGECGASPSFAVYEAGYARAGAHYARQAQLPLRPIHRAMYSDTLLYGMAPGPAALAASAALFAGLGTRWMVAGLDYDARPWLRLALALGADVRVGLEDAPHGCDRGNLAQVEQAVRAVAASGRRLASAAEVRDALRNHGGARPPGTTGSARPPAAAHGNE